MFTGLGRSRAALRGLCCPVAPQQPWGGQGWGGEDPALLGEGEDSSRPLLEGFFFVHHLLLSTPGSKPRRQRGRRRAPSGRQLRPSCRRGRGERVPSVPSAGGESTLQPPWGLRSPALLLRAPRTGPRGVFGRWGGRTQRAAVPPPPFLQRFPAVPWGCSPAGGVARCHPSSGWAPPGARPPLEHPLPEGHHPLTPPLGADGLQLSKPRSEGEEGGTQPPPQDPPSGRAGAEEKLPSSEAAPEPFPAAHELPPAAGGWKTQRSPQAPTAFLFPSRTLLLAGAPPRCKGTCVPPPALGSGESGLGQTASCTSALIARASFGLAPPLLLLLCWGGAPPSCSHPPPGPFGAASPGAIPVL